MTTSSFMPIYFKVARTTDTAMYDIDLNWTTAEFINIMREKVINDFNLENAEFVDTAQELIIGVAAEDAPPLIPSNKTLREYYGIRIYHLAFYIRPLPANCMRIATPEQIPELPQDRACCICLNKERNLLFAPCNHLCACTECGLNPTIRVCPICRTSFTNRIVVYL